VSGWSEEGQAISEYTVLLGVVAALVIGVLAMMVTPIAVAFARLIVRLPIWLTR
jgi:Flp pilus assembly pilin Flp